MKIIAIAKNALKEVIRDKVLYIILIFALGMMVFSTLLYHLSMHQDVKIMKDVGLGMISMFGIIIAIFIGSNMLFKEIDKKTIYLVLSKPIDRTSFLIGKFLGLSAALFIVTAGLALSFYIILFAKDVPFQSAFLVAIFFSYLEMIFIIAVTIFLSTLTSPLITTFCTLAVFLTGRSTVAIKTFIDKMDDGLTHSILDKLFYLIPNLQHVNIINQVVYDVDISLKQSLMVTAYIACYITLLMYISSITFKSKDF